MVLAQGRSRLQTSKIALPRIPNARTALLDSLAILFRDRLLNHQPEPSALSFSISDRRRETMTNLRRIIDILQRAQLVYIRSGPAKERGKREPLLRTKQDALAGAGVWIRLDNTLEFRFRRLCSGWGPSRVPSS